MASLEDKRLLLLDKLTDNSNDDDDDNNHNNSLYCDKSQQERGLRHEALIGRGDKLIIILVFMNSRRKTRRKKAP